MFKKILILLAVLLPSMMKAQRAVGEWYSYSIFSDNLSTTLSMVEGKDGKIYYLSGGNLFSYDNDTKENYSYTQLNRLSDNSHIKSIHYNYDNDYLVAVYENCNIDLLFPDGKTVNMAEIKDAIMNEDKSINDVCFYKGRIYVATSFGLVVYDAKNHYVIESGNYGLNIANVVCYKDNIILATNKGDFYTSPVGDKHYSISSFKVMDLKIGSKKLFSLGDDEPYLYGLVNENMILRTFRPDFNTLKVYGDKINLNNVTPSYGWIGKDNNLYVTDAATSKLFKVKNGAVAETVTLDASINNNVITFYNSSDKLWSANKTSGVSLFDISGGGFTALAKDVKPEAITVDRVFYITPNKDASHIYINSQGATRYRLSVTEGEKVQGNVNIIEDGKIKNVTLLDASVDLPKKTNGYRNLYGTKVVAPSQVAEDINDPSVYYLGGGTEGIYKIRNGEEIGKYNHNNSPMVLTWFGPRPTGLSIDRGGNLWVTSVYSGGNPTHYRLDVMVLPYAKTQLPTDQVKASDWIKLDPLEVYDRYMDPVILPCKHSDMVFVLCGDYNTRLMAYDTNGTYSDFSDDKSYIWTTFLDQDGKAGSVERANYIVEDNDGKIWIGGNAIGVFEIANPKKATDPTMTFSRVKVPRNDGTGYADYLLSTENIYSMSVDPSNRKWIGTEASGLYLVSERGDQVLDQFTIDNSDIPANTILAVFADPNSNRVYVGTAMGLSYYNSTSSAAADDYSNVYAYPNPVRPEYTGWITINGLMDRSLVKICDAMGNTLHQGTSEGGMFMWDGCDMGGNRVKSGVYYVYASQNENGSASGKAATKILVVN